MDIIKQMMVMLLNFYTFIAYKEYNGANQDLKNYLMIEVYTFYTIAISTIMFLGSSFFLKPKLLDPSILDTTDYLDVLTTGIKENRLLIPW
jgi:hypothetical protein